MMLGGVEAEKTDWEIEWSRSPEHRETCVIIQTMPARWSPDQHFNLNFSALFHRGNPGRGIGQVRHRAYLPAE